jgi:adenine-specific DNA-methyltransferase
VDSIDAVPPEAALQQLKTREERYAIGQFFTPPAIAEHMAAAVREVKPESVLDPGVGGGVLLRAVGEGPRLFGLDVDAEAVELAGQSLPDAELAVGDFLDPSTWPLGEQTFGAVIANPPYIRHHNLSAGHKALAQRYSARFGQKVSSLSGSYVYFFLESILRLNDGGRLVFITPTEFLDVRYGQAVKEALLEHCDIEEVLVLEMDELAFEGVLTTSAITVATKCTKPSRRFRLVEGKMNGRVELGRDVTLAAEHAPAYLPWTPLLPTRAERILGLTEGRTAQLGEYVRVRRGIATGDNSFFCLTEAEVEEWRIPRDYLVPVVLGSKDIPADGTLDDGYRAERLAEGARGWLLWCYEPKESLPPALQRYIDHGEALGLPERFNCKTRRPWYGVEPVAPPDFFVTYMSRERARFIRNGVGARCMTSLLNVWAKPEVEIDALQVILQDPVNAQLLREFGRTYGGGLGKIEPGDLLRLPVTPLADAVGQSRLVV